MNSRIQITAKPCISSIPKELYIIKAQALYIIKAQALYIIKTKFCISSIQRIVYHQAAEDTRFA